MRYNVSGDFQPISPYKSLPSRPIGIILAITSTAGADTVRYVDMIPNAALDYGMLPIETTYIIFNSMPNIVYYHTSTIL